MTSELGGGRSMTSRPLTVVVLGAGVAGLAATLAVARDGHRVTLVERDAFAVGEPLDAVDWERKGIPHFQQPHAFTPRGRKEMRETFPDVYDALITAGAWDLDLGPKIKGDPQPDDVDLAFLAVRRPLIEWALRRAVAAEGGVTVSGSTRVTGLLASAGNGTAATPIVGGIETTTGTIDADLVIDAMGRRTPTPEWIDAIGGRRMTERSTDCSIIYYARYYRVREGRTLPDGPSVPGPRGDLGYAAFTTFPGDNRTFCALIATPPAEQALKALRRGPAFEAAVATMPALNAWTNADMAEPITDVLPMGSLHNTIRSFDDGRPSVAGLVSVGDALVHTDPSLSLGLSFALLHARYLVAAIRDHAPDLEALAAAFEAMARPEMEERYGYVAAIDDTRTRLWAGETIDYTRAKGGAYAFFTYAAAGMASLADGDLARALFRRHGFLDPLSVFDDDPDLVAQLEGFWKRLVTAPRASRVGPPRDELLEVIRHAVG
jgi:2-polyprenyl-6-methoxyphenol hydroxylase-like FAD-dependent oxidoreductase